MPVDPSFLINEVIETDNKELAFNRNGEMSAEELN
jgi:hypothetical protein